MFRLVAARSGLLAASLVLADGPDDEKGAGCRITGAWPQGGECIHDPRCWAQGRRIPPGEQAGSQVVEPDSRKRVWGCLHLDVEGSSRGGRVVSRVVPSDPEQRGRVALAVARALGRRATRPVVLDRGPGRRRAEADSGCSPPAASPVQRLRQIRELAKDFTARQISHTGVGYEMRLLLQPIYRYEGTEGDLIDGALFAFVHAGDPEVFLQIEARKVHALLQWQYSLARFNSVFLAASHKGREIWTAEQIIPWTEFLDRRKPYTAIMLGPNRP